MFEYDQAHNTTLEEIVDVLCARTQNQDRPFFRVIAMHFLAKMASSMRASVSMKGRGVIPINCYAVGLSPSGSGKGFSINILEDDIFKGFEKRFLDYTMPDTADKNLLIMAEDRAAMSGEDVELEQQLVQKQYDALGELTYTFDSGTVAGVKEYRQKLLMAKAGALSYAVDEIGSNLLGSTELLNIFLELFDLGKVKSKLTKNTAENKRLKSIDGVTPANMLLFGTPAGLFDGHMVEKSFDSFLEIGYARRCLFGWGNPSSTIDDNMTPEDVYFQQVEVEAEDLSGQLNHKFYKLADPKLLDWVVEVPDPVGIEVITYKMHCENQAKELKEHEVVAEAEMQHRFFKALKFAGTFAYLDNEPEMTLEHWYQAVTLVEEAGAAFNKVVSREPDFARLARFIAGYGAEVTNADLAEALPFFQARSNRKELLDNAIAWGYKNHVVLSRTYVDGIEFFSGSMLEETDLNELVVSHSDSLASGYEEDCVSWDDLADLVLEDRYNFCVHGFEDGHRNKENALPGFNLVVLDIDGTTTLEFAQKVLKNLRYMMYTTKSHEADEHHFRIILPMTYRLELDEPDYKEFMNGIFAWLPFEVDEGGNQQSRKWATNYDADLYVHEGDLFDPLPFIPRTSRNDTFKEEIKQLGNLNNLERWFASRMREGNRNNQMLKYALALVDTGFELDEVEQNVKRFNKQVKPSLPISEIDDTIMTTVAKRYI